MTDKELKRLNRRELLEILIMQMEENEKLRIQLEAANKELENRTIISSRAGSIAQAALQLNNIFEDAENAAKQYLDSIRVMEEELRKKHIALDNDTLAENSSAEVMDENESELENINNDTLSDAEKTAEQCICDCDNN